MSYSTLIDVSSLEKQPDALIFDCRFSLADTGAGERAYAEGHLAGARYLHLDRDLSSPIRPGSGRHPLPDPALLAGKLTAAGLTPERQVVVYDDVGGATAARAWWLLRWLGHPAVAVLNGGWQAWCAAGGAQETGPSVALAASPETTVQVDADAVLTSEALQAELEQGRCLLVDARAAERFHGKSEPLDPVAGHVPGAVNYPLSANLSDGMFRSAEELRRLWLEVLQGRAPEEVVHMCGSGVTACHNLLAMEHVGLCGSRLYAGSWSEWIQDPKRPVAVD